MFKYLDLSYWEIIPGLIKEFVENYALRLWFKYSFYLMFVIFVVMFLVFAMSINTIIDIIKCIIGWVFSKINIKIDWSQDIHPPKFISKFFKKLIFKKDS